VAMFAIHFVCLVNPGEGDGFMSSEVYPLKIRLI
jgi:dolichyl-phosphate-mannose-protein mannosyltransferase